MKKLLSILLILTVLCTMTIAASAAVGDHEHQLMDMANAVCHYSECTICFELFNVGNHIFENGECIVCGHDEIIMGEGAHEHQLMNMADDESHFEECQVCHERFGVEEHTFANGICSVCGHPEFTNPFTDVSESAWYYADVMSAVSSGLINGKTDTEFKSDDYLTYAEAIKLAAILYAKLFRGLRCLRTSLSFLYPIFR